MVKLTRRRRLTRFHLQGAPSLEGVLLGRSRGHYVLTACKSFQDSETSYPLEGEVRVPKERVHFYQVID